MKKARNKFRKYFLSDELPFDTRILNFVCLLGSVAAIVALIVRIIAGMPLETILTMIVMLVVIMAVVYASVEQSRTSQVVLTTALYTLGIVFWPVLFFTNGGADSGMAAYFSLIIILQFLLLNGKIRIMAIVLTSITIVICYISTLFWGWTILPGEGLNTLQRFLDNMQSIFIAGFFLGAVITFQNKVYLKEKNKVEAAHQELLVNEKLLTERLEQQQLMSKISRNFMLKEELDKLIEDALANIGKFMAVERIIISVFEPSSDISRPAYFWFKSSKYEPDSSQKGFSKIIRNFFPVNCVDSEEVKNIYCDNTIEYKSGEFKDFYDKGGIKSFVGVPIYISGNLWGAMSVEKHDDFHSWSESDIVLVNTVSSAISSAVVRDVMEKDRIEALEKAVHASNAKSDFLANMSHEIRTPMNAIIGMTSIGKSSNTLDKKDYAFNKIDSASKHLLGVINDILDMSKIEANKLELSPVNFDFEKMLQKVVNVITFRVDELRQNFYIHIDKLLPKMLIGDDQRISQVITNLLSNAVKFTPEEGTIQLDVDFLSEEDGMCRLQISVKDTGIGITAEQKARLFNCFEQAETGTARKFGGTGLGLSISKRIVEMMGGEIWVESTPGDGSKFIFTLLLKRGVEDKKTKLQKIDFSKVNVLAIDDEPEILEFFQETGKTLGFNCKVADCGEDAIKLIKNSPQYNIYFVDWQLPGIGGVELTKKIVAKKKEGAYVIMISSTDWSVIEDDALGAGVDRFLPKPLFQSSIEEIINECLGTKIIVDEKLVEIQTSVNEEDFAGCEILLAEDVEINREIVIALLEPLNLNVECVENGLQAFEKFKANPDKYDGIFMDVQMPEMDGYEATKAIRDLDIPQAKDIPIIAMTANVFIEDINRCIEVGMNAHVGKPINLDEVVDVMKKNIKKKKS